ncbi:hypothetical protein C8Q77DRAFT_1156007 [Trametes polyzona]|nr:hypothetical protein C8Q77DRAFT_1156007 [Trametes polyzona]
MALVVSPPTEALRRSPRPSVRRQILSPVSSRNGVSSLVRNSAVLGNPSSSRSLSRRDSYKSRSRVSTHSTTSPSRPQAKADASTDLSTRAGAKRKRPTKASDPSDVPRYELVVAEPLADDDAQTPRQLRYAKRQRLLVFQPDTHSSSPAATDVQVAEDLSERNTVSVDAVQSPVSSVSVNQTGEPSALALPSTQDAPQQNPEHGDAVPTNSVSTEDELSDVELEDEDIDGPVFTPFPRLPLYWRPPPATSADPTVWKAACRQRIERLKAIYGDMFRAIVHAEALAFQEAQAKAAAEAQAQAEAEAAAAEAQAASVTAMEDASVTETQFEFYVPPTPAAAQAGAHEDAAMDVDLIDEDEDDEDVDEASVVAYEKVMILDIPETAQLKVPRLPRLAAVRARSLEPHPSSRKGFTFIGRGTPADPQRLADWAAPAVPLPPRAPSPAAWDPEPLFFTSDMIPPPSTVGGTSAIQTDFPLGTIGGAMSWLDPALHAESLSPSPSPVSSFGITPAALGQGDPYQSTSSPSPFMDAAPLNPTGCALHESFLDCLRAPGCAGPGLSSMPSPFFSCPYPSVPSTSLACSPSASQMVAATSSNAELTPSFAAPSAVFPNQELAQFVRSHLVPGSVTLGHALG